MGRRPYTAISLLLLLIALAATAVAPASAAAAEVAPDALLAPLATCPGSSSPELDAADGASTMLCEINYARAQAGVPALVVSTDLGESAASKTADLFACDEFSHYACGQSWLTHFREVGYLRGCWQAGENLAWGQNEAGSPDQIMAAWLASPLHRANIVSTDFSEVGITLERGTFLGYDDVDVWVTHFGSHCNRDGFGGSAGPRSRGVVIQAAALTAPKGSHRARRGLGTARAFKPE